MLVEREALLQDLIAVAGDASHGRGKVVLLSAEAGGGKTTVLNALRTACADTHQWVWGACDALITPRPLGPIHDMADVLDAEVAACLKSPGAPSELYKALLGALENISSPTLLVFEDIHWADHATLDLLKFLGRRITFMNVVLLASFRDDEVGEEHYLRQVLGELPSASTLRVQLEPLSSAAIAELAATAGVDADGIADVTKGNPFFVTELLAARRSSDAQLPSSIRDAIAAQLARIPASTREMLELVSIVPASVSAALSEVLFDASVADDIDFALQRGLLEQDERGALKFRHELARLATLDRIPAARKRACHERVLDVLITEDDAFAVDQIVHHAAGALSGSLVLRYAPQAASIAALSGSHREAVAHLGTALRFVDEAEPAVAASLYERWAYEASLAARIDDEVLEARRHAITIWRLLERDDKVGENLRALSRLHWYRGEAAEATRYSDQAIRILESTPPSAEHAVAYSLRSQLHMLNDQMDDAVRWGERSLALAEQFDAADVRMHALNNIGTALAFRGDEDGVAMLEQSLELALDANHHEHAARAYNNLAEYAVEFRCFDLAEKTLADGIAYDIEHDLDSWTYYLSGRQAQLRMDQGRLQDALTIAQGVIDREKLTLLMKLPAGLVASRTRLRLGEADAVANLSGVLNDALATDELQHVVPARLGLIEAAWLLDLPDVATEHMDALLALSEADRHPWNNGERSIWAKRLGMSDVPVPADLPEPYQLELAGKFGEAAAAWDALGLPYAGALALAQSKKQSELLQALQVFDGVGAQAGSAKVRRQFKSKGTDAPLPNSRRGPYKGAKDHPLGLTIKEQEILSLLAKGFTNREMSERLKRSQRTVEHHVSAVLAKLNASSRIAAVLRVQNEPWLLS